MDDVRGPYGMDEMNRDSDVCPTAALYLLYNSPSFSSFFSIAKACPATQVTNPRLRKKLHPDSYKIFLSFPLLFTFFLFISRGSFALMPLWFSIYRSFPFILRRHYFYMYKRSEVPESSCLAFLQSVKSFLAHHPPKRELTVIACF